ncbi:MAG: DUF2480 family protein [Bacteroidetes bacterium]|nr:MAG: DUF2480 family protein [Bacteroidota bacterium]
MDEIINRVAQSALITLDLEDFYPKGNRVAYDLKQNLFQELILREKDFRQFVSEHSWKDYQDQFVAIYCSADAIVPVWAYMLVSIHLTPFAKKIVFGTLEELEKELFRESLQSIDIQAFKDKKVVIKGCGKIPIPTSAYTEISRLLSPVVASLMYGEPCSTVPLFKKAKK